MKARFVAVLCLCSTSTAPALAQTAPQPDGKLTDWMDNRFNSVVESCLAGATQIKLKRNFPGTESKIVSPVPKRLRDWVKDNRKENYWSLGPRDASRQFGYVFARADVEGGTFPGRVERYLFADYDVQAEKLLLRGGVGELTYSQTCDGAFKLGAETGVGFSGDTIKAAGNATSSGKLKNRVDVAVGTFTSPFVDAYRAPASTSASKAYMALIFWDWRARNGAEEGYLISQFDGMALSRSEESNLMFGGSANASANVGFIPFLTLRTTAEGRYSDETNYSMKSFEVITTEVVPRSIVNRFAVPSEADLISVIALTMPEVNFGDGGNLLIPGLPVLAYVDIPSLPEKFCRDPNNYEPLDVATGSLAIRSVAPRPDGKCRFTVAYTAPNALNSATVDLKFKIHRKAAGLPAGLTGFHFAVQSMQFTRLDIPRLEPEATTSPLYAIEDAEPGNQNLVWQIRGRLMDRNQLVPGVADAELKLAEDCGLPQPYPVLRGEMTLFDRQSDRIGFQLMIRSHYPTSPANDIRIATNPQRTCRVAGTLTYHIGLGAGAQTISRPLNQEIYLKLPDPVTAREVARAAALAN